MESKNLQIVSLKMILSLMILKKYKISKSKYILCYFLIKFKIKNFIHLK